MSEEKPSEDPPSPSPPPTVERALSPTLSSDSDDKPIEVKVRFDKVGKSDDHEDHIMPPLLEYIDANVIGRDTVFEGPYGRKQVVYCDYTASGKPLRFIEEYIQNYVYSYYANTHTSTTTTSRQTTKFRNDAREIIRKCINASENDKVIFTGSGTTGGIHKLIHALQLEGDAAKNTVVFVGPFEHHSNMLPWKETGAKVERIKDNEHGTVNMEMLENALKKYQDAGFTMYAAFSAASNVTGILTDTVAVAEMCHKYGALSFWDYATAGPYLEIDMNPTENGYKDGIFLSPHKFVGGPGTPGLFVGKKHVFQNPVPGGCGGGTVLFVTRDTHLYLKDIEAREEGGTPAIVESIRAGMVFQIKQSVGSKLIEEREEELCQKAFNVWKQNPNLTILGSEKARRLPIFSFLVYHHDSGKLLHHNFVSTLLNDLYGIQARGGCACAGPYALDLLGVSESLARQFMWILEKHNSDKEGAYKEPYEIMKPGFARINLPYFMDDTIVHFILEAVDMVATHGWKLLPQYCFEPQTGSWKHRSYSDKPSFSLHDIKYDDDGIHIKHDANPPNNLPMCTLEDIAHEAYKVFEDAKKANDDICTTEDEVLHFTDGKSDLVWFLQPQEAQIYLATDTLKYKPFRRTTLPFKPRRPTRNYSKSELKRRVLMRSLSESIPEDTDILDAVDGPSPLGGTVFESLSENADKQEKQDEQDKPVEDESPSIKKCPHTRNSKRTKFGRKSKSVVLCEDVNCPNYHEPPTKGKGGVAKGCIIQ